MEKLENKPTNYTLTEKWFCPVSITWAVVLIVVGFLYVGVIQSITILILFALISFVGYWVLKRMLSLKKLNKKFTTQKMLNIFLGLLWYAALFTTTNCVLVTIWYLSMGAYDASYFSFACAFVPLGLALAVSRQWHIK